MTVRAPIAAVAAVLLGACDATPGGQAPGGPVGGQPDGPVASGRAADHDKDKSQQDLAKRAGDLPSPGAGPRFVGKWAADEQSCQSAAWQFTATTLHTPAGSSCSFNRVTQVPGGYDVQATCTAEGPATSDDIHIRFAESAKAMLFDSKTIADAGLVFCGRDV